MLLLLAGFEFHQCCMSLDARLQGSAAGLQHANQQDFALENHATGPFVCQQFHGLTGFASRYANC